MLLRRVLGALAMPLVMLSAAALSGCDDGTAPATVGNPEPSATSTSSPVPAYVALGDSYTAAPGVPQTEQESGCLRSDGNYPHLLAERLGSTFVDVSCSGATTTSLIGAQSAGNHVLPAQFAALDEQTSLVTLGIGGNDLGLFAGMSSCVQLGASTPQGSPCRDQMEGSGSGTDALLDKVDRIGARVRAALRGIHDRSPEATVVLVGYPQLVPATGTCDILPLAQGDYPYVRRIGARLGDVMRQAARQANALYVDMVKASRGHDICAGQDAWVNGIHTDMTRALAFHPFASEQQAVADLVVAALER